MVSLWNNFFLPCAIIFHRRSLYYFLLVKVVSDNISEVPIKSNTFFHKIFLDFHFVNKQTPKLQEHIVIITSHKYHGVSDRRQLDK